MTNFEYLKNLPIEELAPWLVEMRPDKGSYMAPNGEIFRNVHEAIDKTTEWLNKEFTGDEEV